MSRGPKRILTTHHCALASGRIPLNQHLWGRQHVTYGEATKQPHHQAGHPSQQYETSMTLVLLVTNDIYGHTDAGVTGALGEQIGHTLGLNGDVTTRKQIN
jgi:hypothetical protein